MQGITRLIKGAGVVAVRARVRASQQPIICHLLVLTGVTQVQTRTCRVTCGTLQRFALSASLREGGHVYWAQKQGG